MRRAEISARMDGSSSRWRIVGLVMPAILIMAAGSNWAEGQAAQPAGVGDAKATPLAHYVPRQDLMSYIEFDGLDAHQAAWQGSAAQKLLNDTKLGVLLEDLVSQYFETSTAGDAREPSGQVGRHHRGDQARGTPGFCAGGLGQGPG